jgi:trk system potassium uptake protein TrkA
LALTGKALTRDRGVVIIGLGRFGGQVAATLARLGHEVLGVDENLQIVQAWSDRLIRVVQADGTDEDALRQAGVPEFTRAVVGIGTDLEASVLTVLSLAEIGISEIWARATTARHGKILSAVGANPSSTRRLRWATGSPT